MINNQRKHVRTPIKLVVHLDCPNDQRVQVETWDISDAGIGIQLPTNQKVIWSINMKVTAQVKGLPIEGPKLPMKVVRIENDRIGLAIM